MTEKPKRYDPDISYGWSDVPVMSEDEYGDCYMVKDIDPLITERDTAIREAIECIEGLHHMKGDNVEWAKKTAAMLRGVIGEVSE